MLRPPRDSQYGCSHPGPGYSYLALPIYEIFGERGPALNVFALTVNVLTAIALVLTGRRLFDDRLPDAQPELLVGDRDFHTLAPTDRNLILAGESGGGYVYWDATE